ncbi:MAG: hypothetical protein ACI35O_02855 [Bacillaceae bacterium]
MKLAEFTKDNKWNYEIEYEHHNRNDRKMMFLPNSSNLVKLEKFLKDNNWYYDIIEET